jgi:hypothetical protein
MTLGARMARRDRHAAYFRRLKQASKRVAEHLAQAASR